MTRDLGKTWKPHATHRKALIEPRACMASLISINSELTGKPGTRLLFSNPNSLAARQRITIKASPDRGHTWPTESQLLLDEWRSAGYSCLSMIDDETVGILYEGSRAHMTFQRVKLKDIFLMNEVRREKLIAVYRDGLLENTLPFWLPRCVDEEQGGFMIARDRDGSLLDTDKGMWQQGRFTWLLATLYNTVEPRAEWLTAARHGLEFIERHGFDADGQMWFHVTREEANSQAAVFFTETFAAIAYAACAKATGERRHWRIVRVRYTRWPRRGLRRGRIPNSRCPANERHGSTDDFAGDRAGNARVSRRRFLQCGHRRLHRENPTRFREA